MQASPLVLRDLVLVGGGHSHVHVVKSHGMRRHAGVRVTLVSTDADTPYSGMLPGFVAGVYTRDQVHIDLSRLCAACGVRFIRASATRLDADKRSLALDGGRPPLRYDVVSLDVGCSPSWEGVAGAAQHATPVKPISGFAARIATLLARVEAGEAGAPPSCVVVGGGAGGCECVSLCDSLCGSRSRSRTTSLLRLRFHLATHALLLRVPPPLRLAAALGVRLKGRGSVTLLSRGPLMRGHSRRAASKVEAALRSRGVAIRSGEAAGAVSSVADGSLSLCDGTVLPFTEAVWVTRGVAPPWLAASGLAVDAAGCVVVDECLRSMSHGDRNVFASGDCASLPSPRPKAGVFAVRAGPPLAAALAAALEGRAPVPWRPQAAQLALISLGDGHAVASWGRLSAGGGSGVVAAALWRAKHAIDTKFVEQYNLFAPMSVDAMEARPSTRVPTRSLVEAAGADAAEAVGAAAARAMRCGGCGAKVGAPVLDRVLNALAAADAASSSSSPTSSAAPPQPLTSRDDAAPFTLPSGSLGLASVDFFRSFIDDPFILGAVAAIHALGDVWAMGATPLCALAIVTLPHGTGAQQERELTQLMGGAVGALKDAGCALAGGHTAEGVELAAGFAVIGHAPAGASNDGASEHQNRGGTMGGTPAPPRLLSKGGLRPGQVLILTKPLGTGALLAAHAVGRARGAHVQAALASMRSPSSAFASRAFVASGAVTGATDVTGFGIAGHAGEMAAASRVRVRLFLSALPVLDGALDALSAGFASTGSPGNVDAASSGAAMGPVADARAALFNRSDSAPHSLSSTTSNTLLARFDLLFDPQTAGGLLAGVDESAVQAVLSRLRAAGCPHAAIVGEVLPEEAAAGGGVAPRVLVGE